jgi:hypothetical protein
MISDNVTRSQKEGVVRVPDLDWPADLFTDIIEARPESIVAPAAAKRSLWMEMTNAWTRTGIASELQWRVGPFDLGQFAW